MSSILILGASSDIAQAIAHSFAREKFTVMLAGRNSNSLARTQSDIAIRYNVPVELHEFDAARFESHSAFYNSLSTSPDVTVCVFGYLGDQKVAENDWSESKTIIETNFTGAVSILNIVAADYERKGKGTIIGISSVAGERGRQSNYIYGSAKAGFTAYLDGMRNRLFKSNVHVITVKPGFVKTKMTEGLPLPKPLTAQPAQVGDAVFKAFKKGSNTLYVLWMWKWIMLLIKMIPEGIFKKMKL